MPVWETRGGVATDIPCPDTGTSTPWLKTQLCRRPAGSQMEQAGGPLLNSIHANPWHDQGMKRFKPMGSSYGNSIPGPLWEEPLTTSFSRHLCT